MSATAEISKPSTTVTFAAVRDGLRLVKTPRYPVFGPGGRQVGEEPGEAVRFVEGTVKVTDDGVTLEDGRTLPREEALEWLRGHRLYSNLHDGFSEIGQAAPPVSQEELAALLEAVLDEGKLVAIVEAEEQGWQRPALLEPARAHLERLREMIATHHAEQGVERDAAPKRAARAK